MNMQQLVWLDRIAARQSRLLDWGFGAAVNFFLHLALVAVLFVAGWWLWPDGMLGTPLAALTLGELLLAGASLLAYGGGAWLAYVVLVEPVIALILVDEK